MRIYVSNLNFCLLKNTTLGPVGNKVSGASADWVRAGVGASPPVSAYVWMRRVSIIISSSLVYHGCVRRVQKKLECAMHD